MVEVAVREHHAPHKPASSEIEEVASRVAVAAEARTRLPRAADGAPPEADRELARALVDASYMPLADYVALFGPDGSGREEPQRREEPQYAVTGQFRVGYPRRQNYRPTTVRCTFAKPSPRLTRWRA